MLCLVILFKRNSEMSTHRLCPCDSCQAPLFQRAVLNDMLSSGGRLDCAGGENMWNTLRFPRHVAMDCVKP